MAAPVRVALVVPVSGTLGLIGPGAVNCADLAAQEINEAGGSRADAVLLTLVGRDPVDFNRAFAATPLGERVLRLCPALEENGLFGVGGDATGELYSAMGYFASVATDAGLDFIARYTSRFGPLAPVPGGHGEGCYDGLRLLAALVARAGSLATPALDLACDGATVDRGRGRLVMRGRHLEAPVYLARAEALDLQIVAGF